MMPAGNPAGYANPEAELAAAMAAQGGGAPPPGAAPGGDPLADALMQIGFPPQVVQMLVGDPQARQVIEMIMQALAQGAGGGAPGPAAGAGPSPGAAPPAPGGLPPGI